MLWPQQALGALSRHLTSVARTRSKYWALSVSLGNMMAWVCLTEALDDDIEVRVDSRILPGGVTRENLY